MTRIRMWWRRRLLGKVSPCWILVVCCLILKTIQQWLKSQHAVKQHSLPRLHGSMTTTVFEKRGRRHHPAVTTTINDRVAQRQQQQLEERRRRKRKQNQLPDFLKRSREELLDWRRTRPSLISMMDNDNVNNKKKKTTNHTAVATKQQQPYQIGKHGMLLNDPWRRRKQEQENTGGQKVEYAPHGGALLLPTSPTFATHYDESLWPTIDNGTCLYDDDSKDASPVYEWQLRAPYVILLGTMKGGTQALTTYLWQHPLFAQKDQGMEMHFFDQQDFVRTEHGIPRRHNQLAYAKRFQKSHSRFFSVQKMRDQNVTDRMIYAMDSSPYYLLGSDRIPDAIQCVAPWAKLLAILRNPISRAESHFRYLHQARFQNHKPMVDWQVWINDDIRLLTEAGVLLSFWNSTSSTSSQWTQQQQDEFDAFSGSAAEMQAWKRYNRSPSSQQIVGRGLYAIQVGHYLASLIGQRETRRQEQQRDDDNDNHTSSVQRILSEKLLVITSEDLNTHTQEVYNRVLTFLQLPRHVLLDTNKVHAADASLPDIPMPKHVRQQLERLYEPYNQRLFRMLGWSSTVW